MRNKEKLISFFASFKGYITLFCALVFTFVIALCCGSAKMSFGEFFDALFLKGNENTIILYSVRLPRVLAGGLAGVGLSVSGVLLQSITNNSLASPGIIGVNSGAGFFVSLSLILPLGYNLILTPIFAFIGAFLTTLFVVFLSSLSGKTKASVILSGVAINALLNALISLITLIDSDVLVSYNSFSIGGFAGVQYKALLVPFIIISVCFILCLVFSKPINLLCLGKNTASSLGVNVRALRTICIIIASASASCAVSFAGLLGFVGLIVPHIARFLCGESTKALFINSAFLGAIITISADLLGRVIIAPGELPVGIMMAFIGVPFFFLLLFKKRGQY